jgi:hypothetical protein
VPVLEIIGWLGGLLLIVSFLQTRILRLRLVNLAGSIVLVFYNAVVEVWPMVGLNAAMIVINTGQILRLVQERRAGRAFEVLEVDPLSDYLRHYLRVHEEDIRSFVPGFVWDGAAPGRAAFLVLRGDETAGTVLLHDAGDGVAQVELDYVTRRFRDFAPGRHVYEDSGLFADRGFTEIRAPRGMRAEDGYLERMGFIQDRGQWRRPVRLPPR